MIWEDTWTIAALDSDDCNKNAWRCGGDWPKQEDINVHAVLYQLLKCEVKQTKD